MTENNSTDAENARKAKRSSVKISVPSKFMQQLNANKPVTASHKLNAIQSNHSTNAVQPKIQRNEIINTPATNKTSSTVNTPDANNILSDTATVTPQHVTAAIVTTPPFVTQTPVVKHSAATAVVVAEQSPPLQSGTSQFIVHSATTNLQSQPSQSTTTDSTTVKTFLPLDQLKQHAAQQANNMQIQPRVTPRRSTVETLPSHISTKLLSPVQQRRQSIQRHSMTSPNSIHVDSKYAAAANNVAKHSSNSSKHSRANSVTDITNKINNIQPIAIASLDNSVISHDSHTDIQSQPPVLQRQPSSKQELQQQTEHLHKLRTILLQQAYFNHTSIQQQQHNNNIALHQFNDVYNQIKALNTANAQLKLSIHRHKLLHNIYNALTMYSHIIPDLSTDLYTAIQQYQQLMNAVVISLSQLPIRNMNHTVNCTALVKHLQSIASTFNTLHTTLTQHHTSTQQLYHNTHTISTTVQQHTGQLNELSALLQQLIQCCNSDAAIIWQQIDALKVKLLQSKTTVLSADIKQPYRIESVNTIWRDALMQSTG